MERQWQLQVLQKELQLRQRQQAEGRILFYNFCALALSRVQQLQRRTRSRSARRRNNSTSSLQQYAEEHMSLQNFCTAASSRLQQLQQRGLVESREAGTDHSSEGGKEEGSSPVDLKKSIGKRR